MLKSIKTSVTTTVKITDRKAGMQNELNELNCQITRIKKMSAKLFKTLPNFQLVWTLEVEKFRTIMVNIAKTHILLVKKRNL